MVFEARYRTGKLAKWAAFGLFLVGAGLWMVLQPSGSLDHTRGIGKFASLTGADSDLVGRGVGGVVTLFGVLLMAAVVRLLRCKGPAIRVDQHGVYCYAWSRKQIGWDNVLKVEPITVQNEQKMVGLTLRNPSLDPPSALWFRLFKPNRVGLSVVSTDASFHDLLVSLRQHADPANRPAQPAA